MDVMDQAAEFRIAIPEENVAAAGNGPWGRLRRYVETTIADDGGWWIERWEDVPRLSFVYRGYGPIGVITALQAAARGDDLLTVLDMLEADP